MIKKNYEKGITLIYLIIILIIIIIISGTAIYNGFDSMQETRKTTLLNELQIIQGKVDVIYEQIKNGEINYDDYLNELKVTQDIEIEAINGIVKINSDFRKFESQDDLRKIGVDGIRNTYYINFETAQVVSRKGFKEEDKQYHTLKDFGYYQTSEQTNIKSTLSDDFKINVTITYPENSTENQYKLNANGQWTNYEGMFTISNNTEVHTKFIDANENEIISTIKKIKYDRLTDNGIHNTPRLVKGMTPIKLDNDGNWGETTENDAQWYNYQNQKYAHIKLKDGSIFVWIPRFTVNQTSLDVMEYSNGVTDKYTTNTLFNKNGYELTGIWVAKYPASDIIDMNLIQSKQQDSYNFSSIEDLEEKCTYIKQYTGTYGLYESEVDTFIIMDEDTQNIRLLNGYDENLVNFNQSQIDRPLIIIK